MISESNLCCFNVEVHTYIHKEITCIISSGTTLLDFSALEALRNAIYKFYTYLLTYFLFRNMSSTVLQQLKILETIVISQRQFLAATTTFRRS